MYKSVLFLVVAFAGQIAVAQIGAPCHSNIFQMTPRHNINLTAFMGDWYAQEYATSNIGNTPEPDYRCARSSFHQPNASDITKISRTDSWVNLTSAEYETEDSFILINNTRSPFTAMWNSETADGAETAQIIVFQSDLEHAKWAIMYQCSHRAPLFNRWETLRIYSRSRLISDDDRHTLKALMVGYGFRIGDHKPIYQNGCD